MIGWVEVAKREQEHMKGIHRIKIDAATLFILNLLLRLPSLPGGLVRTGTPGLSNRAEGLSRSRRLFEELHESHLFGRMNFTLQDPPANEDGLVGGSTDVVIRDPDELC